MAKIIGVSNARLYKVGRFNPPKHRGIDVFAPPGSDVTVPLGWTIQVTRSYVVGNWGQVQGWATICGKRYGFAAAHWHPTKRPKAGTYQSGEYLGDVAGHVRFTPHIHWSLNPNAIPPQGTVDPLKVWRECLEKTIGAQGVLIEEDPPDDLVLHEGNEN